MHRKVSFRERGSHNIHSTSFDPVQKGLQALKQAKFL